MSKSTIPNDQWQPWQLRELNQWDLNSGIPVLSDVPEPDAPKVPCLEPKEVLEQINLLDNIKEDAQRTGFQQGHEKGQQEGYQAGFEQGLRAGEEQGREQALAMQQPVIETWQKLLSEFNYSLDTFDTVVTTKLLQIALTAAKQVLGQSTVCDGTALLEEISHLLQQKPIFAGQPELHVNPNHFELIEQHLGSLLNLNGWRLVADPKLHLGGCRVVAEDGEIDMTGDTLARVVPFICTGELFMTARLGRWIASLDDLESRMKGIPMVRRYGRLTKITGLVMEAEGIKMPLGATCFIERSINGGSDEVVCEVVGFNGPRMLLMPLADLEGIAPGARVYAQSTGDDGQTSRLLPIGNELLGRVLDAQGNPLDGKGPLEVKTRAPLITPPINPLERTPISSVLDVGVRAINALLTVGRGQRMGLFAGSGVGKSVLLGMMARFTQADIIVVGLIGERGREVKDFIENILGPDGLKRAVVVAAPADVSPLLRMQGASYATRIAEYFRDKGLSVLLIMDSLTRYSMAQREIALAVGEPPATKGYPPSVFAKLPALVERAGNGKNGGSITAFYTVLTEGDDQQDPIADSARAILDGHIVLSRSLAESGHYPAIDIEASISRAMTELIPKEHYRKIQRFKQLTSSYQRNRDLINVGAYAMGSDPMLDTAIQYYPRMSTFLQQDIDERCDYQTACDQLTQVVPNE